MRGILLLVLSSFLATGAFGYPKKCNLETDECVLELVKLNEKLALKVIKMKKDIAQLKRQVAALHRENEKLKARVKSLEVLVDRMISGSEKKKQREKATQHEEKNGKTRKEVVRKVTDKKKVYQLATFAKVTPYSMERIWKLLNELNSMGVEARIASSRKGFLVLYGRLSEEEKKQLKELFPDMLVPQKIKNPSEFFDELPVLVTYEDFVTYITNNYFQK